MTMLPLLICLAVADPLAAARDHINHGRYDEALDAFAEAGQAGADPAAVALGVSRVRIETGRYAEAAEAIETALRAAPQNPDLLARRGELRLLRGDFAGATADAEAALKQDAEHPAAHWVKAEALTETGRIAEAADECRWFVRHYNRVQPTDPETLVYVAKGSLRYARWKRVSSIFHFTINELCPDIAKADPDDWRADAISGSLLLEKYNEAQGVPDLERALAKNPNAAEVHAALAVAAFEEYDLDEAAERSAAALAINPALLSALGVKADLAIVEGDFDAARETLAAVLAVNPHDQETLARQAALDVIEGKVTPDAYDALLAASRRGQPAGTSPAAHVPFEGTGVLLKRNPKPGPFLARLGATLERRRLYDEAERAYEAAIEVMPELPEPQVALGLLSMRAGDLARAKGILDAAFKADPFHVRVSNMRKVVGLLEGYDTVETPHFVIRFDPAKDRVLAELAAEYLEAAYPELTAEFGFEPPGKTVVELFHGGRGQSGHEWFSARMVGLPWLQTIGASTGLMIALASPTSGPEYNWARVVRHEFTHVVTLQQTDFRIPHWYTEALAVR
ncbi:MAG TPA: tetratricopeptide repeat protein, partial [Planctomycetaceae bacterium]